jgi:hypothetical protein
VAEPTVTVGVCTHKDLQRVGRQHLLLLALIEIRPADHTVPVLVGYVPSYLRGGHAHHSLGVPLGVGGRTEVTKSGHETVAVEVSRQFL